jgi:hypothetical protein
VQVLLEEEAGGQHGAEQRGVVQGAAKGGKEGGGERVLVEKAAGGTRRLGVWLALRRLPAAGVRTALTLLSTPRTLCGCTQ